ncbi:DMT family transporter [Marinomonas aquiplantarum]|uniref:EamA-like transporter family protein n=1 Tax=Marinomonas aquiplantarum TaxID=491951 RepID=A0A366D7C0_9GAMM|nr:DMT family transporter [Marinomonas aquiplantarum]RBO85951.1 EamA-like transporter family protein [Marinomonas aquiplantarum]
MNPFITLFVWALLMASSFVVSGNMVAYASPIATAFFRFVLALVLMVGILLVKMQMNKSVNKAKGVTQLSALFSSQKVWQYAVISGALVGFFIGMFAALESTTPLHTSVLYTLVPLMGVLIAKFWLGESASILKVFGFVLGSFGAVLVLLATQGNGPFVWHKGDYIFLGASVLLAFHVVSVQKWGQAVGAFEGAFLIMLFGTIWLLPIAIMWGDLSSVAWGELGFWLNGLYLTVFTTLFTFMLQQILVRSVGANRILAASYTIPVWVALWLALSSWQWTLLFNMGFGLGLVCLLLALYLIDKQNRNRVLVGLNSR